MAELSGKSGGRGNKRKSRLVAALLAIFFGCLGVHKFYLRQIKAGLVQLFGLVILFTAAVAVGIATGADWLWQLVFVGAILFGVVEGVLYTRLSDAEFTRIHVTEGRAWPYLGPTFTLNSWRDIVVYAFAIMYATSWINSGLSVSISDVYDSAEETEAIQEETGEEEELAAEEAEQQVSDEAEEETEAGDGTVSGTSYTKAGTSTVSYTIDNRYLAGDVDIEFVETTEDGVVVTVTTDNDRAFLDIYLISVDGTTYRSSDFYWDTDDYSFGIYLWSDGKQEWGNYYPSITVEEDDTLVLMLSCFDDIEFDEMTIYCEYTVYILNSSDAVTSSFDFEGITVTLTKD